jgi:hypothetical protein
MQVCDRRIERSHRDQLCADGRHRERGVDTGIRTEDALAAIDA